MGETSVYASFKPIFYSSKIFGTMPLKLDGNPPFGFVRTKPASILSWICLFVSFIHGVSTPWFVRGDSKTASTIVSIEPSGNVSDYVSFIRNQTSVQMVAMRMMNPLIITFMSLGALIVSIIFVQRDLPHFFSNLSLIDVSLNAVVRPIERQDYKISVIVLVYFCALMTPTSLFYLSYTLSAIQGWEFIWNFILTANNVVSYTAEVQFINLAFYLQVRFRMINKFLKNYRSETVSSKYFSVYKNFLPAKDHLTLRKVELLHHANKKLCDLMKDLNSIYQFQLLCSTAGCFIKVLFNIYFGMFGSYVGSLMNQLQVIKIVLWTIFYLTRFLVTTIAASLTSIEALKTKSLVAHVNSRHLSPEIKEEALATGTTYLVVLVQFRPQI